MNTLPNVELKTTTKIPEGAKRIGNYILGRYLNWLRKDNRFWNFWESSHGHARLDRIESGGKDHREG